MAEYNVKINVKTDTGYDQLYPKSKSDIIDFDKTSSNLSSTNVEAAIKEVNTKANTNKTNIGTLTSLTTNSKTNLVGAINEVDSHANTAQSTANTNKTNIGTLSSLKTTIKTSIVNAINWLYDNVVHKANVIDSLDDILANQANGMVAGAKAVAELNGKITTPTALISRTITFKDRGNRIALNGNLSDYSEIEIRYTFNQYGHYIQSMRMPVKLLDGWSTSPNILNGLFNPSGNGWVIAFVFDDTGITIDESETTEADWSIAGIYGWR